ncbi:hypothetical protein RFI_35271, partial [Reticulomyxa filosa]
MKYVSVWSNENENEIKKSKEYNKWINFTDNNNNIIHIRTNEEDYCGARAIIGGSNNHLLFITYAKDNIRVFDLNTFQFIKHGILPTNNTIRYHCFILRQKNGCEIIRKKEENKKINEMILFHFSAGLLIEYDEDKNTFQFHNIPVCDYVAKFYRYAYIYINDVILFFGGYRFENKEIMSKSFCKYFIQDNTWTIFKNVLPIQLRDSFGILNENNTEIHLIGGASNNWNVQQTHIHAKVCELKNSENLVIF